MTQELSDIVFLSLFYWGLSVLMLRIIIPERRQRLYLISAGYLVLSVGVWQAIAMKWLLAASLVFMVVSMLITLWILLKQSRECIRELKAMHEAEKHEKHSQKEEISHGE